MRSVCNVETVDGDQKNEFDNSKQDIMSNQGLKNYDMALWRRHLPDSSNASDEVYDVFLQKTIHVRFAVIFRCWKETNAKKHG